MNALVPTPTEQFRSRVEPCDECGGDEYILDVIRVAGEAIDADFIEVPCHACTAGFQPVCCVCCDRDMPLDDLLCCKDCTDNALTVASVTVAGSGRASVWP